MFKGATMPRFVYKAKDGPRRTVEGELDAETRSAAVARIDMMGYSPVWVRERAEETSRRVRFRGRRIRQRDVTVFTRQLASLQRSGVPILRAMSTIGQQTENSRLRRIIKSLEDSIRDGNMLSGALSEYPALFPEIYVSMVRSGESAGRLDTVLLSLADAREKEEETRRKVQAATAYPMLVIVVGIITIVVLLTFFLPRIIELFKDYGQLPLPTRILIGTNDFLRKYWHFIVLVGVLLFAVVRQLAALEKGRTFFDRIKLHLPLIGRYVLESEIARFARTLSLLIDAGIAIDKALALSADTFHNAVLKNEIREVRQRTVGQGMALSAGLKRTSYFPSFVANMSAVGEEGGRLPESLAEIASFYETQVEQQSRLATSLLEPVLILVVGAIVGFIVSAMLLPIFEIGTSI